MMSSLFKTMRKPVLILALLSAVALTGCQSIFTPASTQAESIANLTIAIFIIAAIVFVIVEGIMIYLIIRFSRNRPTDEIKTLGNEKRIEAAWTAAPAIVLAIVFVVSILALRSLTTLEASRNQASPGSGQTLNIRIIGHQWWWEFDYTDLGIITAEELHVPVGTTVVATVDSADVIHSFWTPELGGKIDAIPGQTNRTLFTVTRAGEYNGQCSEFCGLQHAQMLFKVIAEPQAQFNTWVQGQKAPAPVMTGLAAQGEQVFMTGACVGCHAINGTVAKGTLGPNLTHFASRGTFGGASQQNTPDNVAKWLADPQLLKPGNSMPNLHLTPDQIQALVAYLQSLK
jgi:cytochrome c oxidase subunit II